MERKKEMKDYTIVNQECQYCLNQWIVEIRDNSLTVSLRCFRNFAEALDWVKREKSLRENERY